MALGGGAYGSGGDGDADRRRRTGAAIGRSAATGDPRGEAGAGGAARVWLGGARALGVDRWEDVAAARQGSSLRARRGGISQPLT